MEIINVCVCMYYILYAYIPTCAVLVRLLCVVRVLYNSISARRALLDSGSVGMEYGHTAHHKYTNYTTIVYASKTRLEFHILHALIAHRHRHNTKYTLRTAAR